MTRRIFTRGNSGYSDNSANSGNSFYSDNSGYSGNRNYSGLLNKINMTEAEFNSLKAEDYVIDRHGNKVRSN